MQGATKQQEGLLKRVLERVLEEKQRKILDRAYVDLATAKK